MKHLLLIIITATLLPAVAWAEDATTPEVIKRGFDAYLKSGANAGLDEWLKDSPVENDKTTRLQVTGGLATIETAYGKLMGWDLIRVVWLSDSTRRVYAVAKYEKGPVYMSFDCYKNSDWIIPTLDLNTKANLVLPPNLLGGQ